ncbi:hypothetical protein [Alteromonas oceanisediminis]|uniref:hypothetical protein n=1 Tax=Alteromonas oceanisediminis TaxID=2836180 RepID=UPI001BD9DE29|nr:hypothetical protein [Alteromonas oceanisediminis]MBT0586126.1 hypothetical protein [Alteromonas oceanisediminis]
MEFYLAPDHPQRLTTSVAVQRFPLAKVVLCSLLVHALIVAGLMWLGDRPESLRSTPNSRSIDATLVFVEQPPPPPAEVKAEVEPEVVSQSPPLTSPGIASDTPAKAEPDVIQQDIPVPEVETRPSREQRSSGILSTQQSTQSFLQKYHQQRVGSLSEQQSQQYRQQQRSPNLNIPTRAELEEDGMPGEPMVVACDDTAANALRIVGSFMGGRMRCRDKPDIDQFIQKRLNKETQ